MREQRIGARAWAGSLAELPPFCDAGGIGVDSFAFSAEAMLPRAWVLREPQGPPGRGRAAGRAPRGAASRRLAGAATWGLAGAALFDRRAAMDLVGCVDPLDGRVLRAGDRAVVCRSCGTGYHLESWRYLREHNAGACCNCRRAATVFVATLRERSP